ncbi:hypothetical protein FSP39_019475 [Pinctada imbricata]|uniref:Integrase catalytic domain-containing protein n=1 Tax=Pinctada imbricata TaxID=66713 RepID=A0AA89C724_PINIB|nr:hypothetical protein FSP39_019475 [Pinctada imbricata]
MKTITSENTIAKLQQIFSTHGIPDTIVSDNGPSFTSDKWLPGYITEKSGPLSYRIRLSDDNIIRRHVDHLRPRQTADPVITPDFEIETSTPSEIKPLEETTQSETTEPRYPKRQKREPAYLKDYVR